MCDFQGSDMRRREREKECVCVGGIRVACGIFRHMRKKVKEQEIKSGLEVVFLFLLLQPLLLFILPLFLPSPKNLARVCMCVMVLVMMCVWMTVL